MSRDRALPIREVDPPRITTAQWIWLAGYCCFLMGEIGLAFWIVLRDPILWLLLALVLNGLFFLLMAIAAQVGLIGKPEDRVRS